MEFGQKNIREIDLFDLTSFFLPGLFLIFWSAVVRIYVYTYLIIWTMVQWKGGVTASCTIKESVIHLTLRHSKQFFINFCAQNNNNKISSGFHFDKIVQNLSKNKESKNVSFYFSIYRVKKLHFFGSKLLHVVEQFNLLKVENRDMVCWWRNE